MYRKKISAAMLAAVMIITIPFTAIAANTDEEITLENGTKMEIVEYLDIWTSEMMIDTETSKKASNAFESQFALDYGIYHGNINVNFYNDSKEVIFEDSDSALPESIRSNYKKWLASDDYMAWLADKKADEHIASNIERENRVMRENCWSYGCYRSYYVITYYHYENAESQEPLCAYQKQVQYNKCCGYFMSDYLNETDLDEMNADKEIKEIKDYTEEEMYEYMHNHLVNTMSNNFVSEYMKIWAKSRLLDLDNGRLIYAVDNENHLYSISFSSIIQRDTKVVKQFINTIEKRVESFGNTITLSNFESVMKKAGK